MRARTRVSFSGTLILTAAILLSSCGGRVPLPTTGGRASASRIVAGTRLSPTTDSAGGPATETSPTTSADLPTSTNQPTVPRPAASPANPTTEAILTAYEGYLTDLSVLDDDLNSQDIGPLASVTTTRLAQASVRQAAALQAAKEHGVGILRDDDVKIVMTGPDSASLVDCQDEEHFYLVEDESGTPDPFVARGYFVGSAQLVIQQGRWLVDVFTTTHVTCTY